MNELISALGLQRGTRMKSILVGFVAAVVLSGCGVGVDDPEGLEASTGTTSVALMGNGDNTTTAQAEFRNGTGGDPRIELPQDPIPVYVGNVAPTPGRPGR